MMDTKKCGENLKRSRKKKGIKRQELANQLNLSDGASIANWENGKNHVPEQYRNQVASILDLAKSEFVPTIGYVYVFYYPDAETEENNTYPCKIGHTTKQSVEHRVKWKVKREWKEKREYKIMLRIPLPIDECEVWERKIHYVLKACDRWIDKVKAERLSLKGTEWFYTTPDEVKSIYEALRSSVGFYEQTV